MLFRSPINAKPDDYSFELAALNSDQSIVTIRLKNKLKNQLVPDALIDCAADVGAQGVTTMTEPMLAQPGLKKGEYVLILEPGMQAFDLDLFADDVACSAKAFLPETMGYDGDVWSTIAIFLVSEVAATFRLHSEDINQAARDSGGGDSQWLTLGADVLTAGRPGADCFPGFCLVLDIEQFRR